MTLGDLSIKHHFGDNEYIKETLIPAETELEQHKHKHSHLSVLVSGLASVTVDGRTITYNGHSTILIEAGKAHKVVAHTDCVWLCIWGTTEKNVAKIDAGLIE